MNFNELKDFIKSKMRMSHIYQPVMLKLLLEREGKATDEEIAKRISVYDQSQIEYYLTITNNMVGKVLRNHGIVTKNKHIYQLEDIDKLSSNEISTLKDLCDQKLDEYIRKRGDKIWEHRNHTRGYISGTIKYEVLKRAKFRCELCGISADEKALEVDHIVPKNLGGEDSVNNYQALCYTCNATKKDKDNTDFRGQRDFYEGRDCDCIFCNPRKVDVVLENNLAYLIFDKFPVTDYHSLVIPKRHFKEYFEIGQSELNAVNQLLHSGKDHIQGKDGSVEGYNIGVNNGATSGQTIMHCHFHLIPRRNGDVQHPRGGIRHVIPGKGSY